MWAGIPLYELRTILSGIVGAESKQHASADTAEASSSLQADDLIAIAQSASSGE